MKTLRQEAIIQILRSRLCSDQRTCGQTIDVVISNGDVELLGFCDSEEQKAAAEMIAGGTSGVRVVTDRLKVRKGVLSP